MTTSRCFLALLPALFFAVMLRPFSAAASENTPSIKASAERPYGGLVRPERAAKAAGAAARIALAKETVAALAKNDILRFILAPNPEGHTPPVLLARKNTPAFVYSLAKITSNKTRANRENDTAAVIAEISAEPVDDLRERVIALLHSSDYIELYSGGLLAAERQLKLYDELAETALHAGSSRYTQSMTDSLERRLNSLLAAMLYLDALPLLDGSAPKDIPRANAMLREAHQLDPENALVLCSLGELLIQANRLNEAEERLDRALKYQPDLPRAYHLRGAVYLQGKLSALAVKDFDAAISLAPSNPTYRNSRAAAYLVENKIPEMCADLNEACRLGDCSSYTWAKKEGQCPD